MNTTPIHIPALRFGQAYVSLDTAAVSAVGSDTVIAQVSQLNAGMIRRDARRFAEGRAALRRFTTAQLLDISRRAGELFMSAALPIGDTQQTVDDYMQCLSATSGLPIALVKANMHKIHEVFTQMDTIVRGLTRGVSHDILDTGSGQQAGVPVSFYPTTTALGVVLPSNSPGVNSLWMPAIAMKMPVLLKPGREEPWTPMRIIQSFIAAGIPAEAFGFYPTDHEGSAAVLETCQRSIIFGGQDTVDRYAGNPRVEAHGPGWSKVLIGDDEADRWRDHLPVLVKSIAGNSGRSCINASAILTPRHAKELAQALAVELAAIAPRHRDDPQAALAGFANPQMAQWMNAQIEQGLATPGARDITAEVRGSADRLVVAAGITYMLPTLILCDRFDHPLANREFMFPFASVTNVPQEKMLDVMGPSLVVTAITQSPAFIDDLLTSPQIQRLNLGPLPTSVAKWDQPHEGNLFEFLFRRRAIQFAPLEATAP
jgi:acyl-CoA reductase-like NAD-dependent aldehyde dehydrogenase